MKKSRFYLKMAYTGYKKGDILATSSGEECVVVKVCNRTWWKILLNIFGFNFKIDGSLLMEPIEK